MTKSYTFPDRYCALLSPLETQQGIKIIKDFFERALARKLELQRVTAPLFVPSGTGINDDLCGVEQPIRFRLPHLGGLPVEIVQSLAKWKRLMLAELSIPPGQGIYTDMNAIRPDEAPDALHSIYVDQWDWEKALSPEERSLDYLKAVVREIYQALKETELEVHRLFPQLDPRLPPEVHFLHSEELLANYPGLTPAEREHRACREKGAIFVIGIGSPLADGRPHDKRAPDYDDWSTPNGGHGKGLNGDIIVWHPLLQCALEVSSMGIRVDPPTLERQLAASGQEGRKGLFFHRRLLAGELPLSIGGGIGQSRLCMLLLQKAHIGEVQAGIWPEGVKEDLRLRRIFIL